MKNIIILSHHPENDARIENHIDYIKEEYNVLYINYNIENSELKEGYYKKNGVAAYRFNNINTSLKRRMFFLSKKIVKKTQDIIQNQKIALDKNAILHVHDPHCLYFAKKLKQKNKDVKIVYDRHELYNKRKNLKIISDYALFEKASSKYIDYVVLVAEDHIKDAKKIFGEKNYTVVSNFPYSKKYNFEKIKQKTENLDQLHFTYIGYLGHDHRDIEGIIEISQYFLKKYPNIHFHIAGKGEKGTVKAQLNQMHKDYDNFNFYGYITRKKAIELTEKSHFGFLLIKENSNYWVKSSPNKVYEYLICNAIPIIHAPVYNKKDFENAIIEIKEKYTTQKMIKKIENHIKNPEKIKQKIQTIEKLPKMTYESQAKKYFEIYEN